MASLFDLDEFLQFQMPWQARVQELKRRRSYYDGSIYKQAMEQIQGPAGAYLQQKIRPLYLPLAEAVDVDTGIIPGGWAWPDPETREGVTPAQVNAWAMARRQVFDWSSWATEGVLYVHYGAETGLSVLRIADLRDRNQIQIAPADPATVLLVENGQYDSTPAMAIVIEERMFDGEKKEYAEVIDPETIRTFVAGQPAGIDGRDPEYPNELGFVPFVEIEHKKTGRKYGECTYQRTIPMLDEVNRTATDLAKNIKEHGTPQWVVIGAGEASDLHKAGDLIWYIPESGDVRPRVAQLDISGALAFIEAIAANVYASLPELAFRELISKDQIATATVELQLMPLILKIKRSRPNYDQGLVDALRLAGQAAASMNLSEIAVLDDENLALDPDRPILPPDPMDAINLELAELNLEMQRSLASGEGMTAATNA